MKEIVTGFLSQKKEAHITQKTTAKLRGNKNEFDEATIAKTRESFIDEAQAKYNLNTWIENIIRKVKPNVTTHPAKFTNAKINGDIAQIFLGQYHADGYVRTGNVRLKNVIDVSGNAATNTMVFELYELLDTNVADKKFADYFKENNEQLVQFIESLSADFELVKQKCMQVYFGCDQQPITHQNTRQVYFPVDEDYHLLSIKTASALMFEVKHRIDAQDVWIDGKHIRQYKKENKYLENGFSEIFGITEIGFDHKDFKKMSNYSYLNVKNKGIAYLLPSLPPTLKKQAVRKPKTDFFRNTLYIRNFENTFKEMHKLIQTDYNNRKIQQGIENCLQFIIDSILYEATKLQQLQAGWSDDVDFDSLPLNQKIWLDTAHHEQKQEHTEWADDITKEMARWIRFAYEKIQREDAKLGDQESQYIESLISTTLEKDKEYL